MINLKYCSRKNYCLAAAVIVIYCTITILLGGDCMKHQIKRGQFSLPWGQVEKIINNAVNIRDRILLQTMAYSGCRRAEICQLLINDIDPAGFVSVIGKGKRRIIPVPNRIIQDLQFWIGNRRAGYVFPGRQAGKPLDPSQVNRALLKAARAAKIKNPDDRMKNINPHLLRHSLAHKLKAQNIRLDIIQNILGHANYSTTANIYGLPGLDEITAAYHAVMS